MNISTNELRFQFDKVLRALKKGLPLTLTYRNQPIARILPIVPADSLPADDPLYHFHKKAVDMGDLTNKQIDEIVYRA